MICDMAKWLSLTLAFFLHILTILLKNENVLKG